MYISPLYTYMAYICLSGNGSFSCYMMPILVILKKKL